MAATYAFVIVSYTLFNSCIILVFVIAHHVIDTQWQKVENLRMAFLVFT